MSSTSRIPKPWFTNCYHSVVCWELGHTSGKRARKGIPSTLTATTTATAEPEKSGTSVLVLIQRAGASTENANLLGAIGCYSRRGPGTCLSYESIYDRDMETGGFTNNRSESYGALYVITSTLNYIQK